MTRKCKSFFTPRHNIVSNPTRWIKIISYYMMRESVSFSLYLTSYFFFLLLLIFAIIHVGRNCRVEKEKKLEKYILQLSINGHPRPDMSFRPSHSIRAPLCVLHKYYSQATPRTCQTHFCQVLQHLWDTPPRVAFLPDAYIIHKINRVRIVLIMSNLLQNYTENYYQLFKNYK